MRLKFYYFKTRNKKEWTVFGENKFGGGRDLCVCDSVVAAKAIKEALTLREKAKYGF